MATLVRRSGHHMTTGFAGTPIICDAALAMPAPSPTPVRAPAAGGAAVLVVRRDDGRHDHLGTVGWTTTRWQSEPGEMNSFNHYALGSVADWLHRSVGGLAPAEPGYRRLLVPPDFGPGSPQRRYDTTRHTDPPRWPGRSPTRSSSSASWCHRTPTRSCTSPAPTLRQKSPQAATSGVCGQGRSGSGRAPYVTEDNAEPRDLFGESTVRVLGTLVMGPTSGLHARFVGAAHRGSWKRANRFLPPGVIATRLGRSPSGIGGTSAWPERPSCRTVPSTSPSTWWKRLIDGPHVSHDAFGTSATVSASPSGFWSPMGCPAFGTTFHRTPISASPVEGQAPVR